MAEKEIKTRIQQKHDTSTNWAKATNFVPKAGEIIVYDDLRKIKIGDGSTTVSNLQFISGGIEGIAWGQITGTLSSQTDLQTALNAKQDTISDLSTIRSGAALGATALQSVPNTYRTAAAQDTIDNNKVDKVDGKGLSTNDYTTEEKTKLSGIATGAEVNVQSDWSQTDTSADDYIKNKPTIPTVPTNVSAFTNDAGYLTSHQSLSAYRTASAQDTIDAGKLATSLKGAANGVASLDATGKVPSTQLPSYVDDVIEAASVSAFPNPGESGKIYVALDTNKTYRWGGTEYVVISETLAIGTTATTAAAGNHTHSQYLTEHQSLAAYRTAAAQDVIDATKGTYSKPSGGIPSSDMTSAVQSSLGKADTALQSVPSTYRTAAAQDTIDAGKQDKLPTVTKDRYLHTNASTGALEWSSVQAGAQWGSITGTLSNQTDLQTALNAKANDNAVVHSSELISTSMVDVIEDPASKSNGQILEYNGSSWVASDKAKCISNPNLLDNWYFGNPVNSRGQSSYFGWGYAIDRWLAATDDTTNTELQINNGYIIYIGGSNSTYSNLEQQMSHSKNNVYTLSFLVDDYTKVNQIYFLDQASTFSFNGNLLSLSYSGTPSKLGLQVKAGQSVKIYAAKLEVGNQQTLAHQENGIWVLNEIPNYNDQLLRCITSTADSSDTYANKYIPGLTSAQKPVISSVDREIFASTATPTSSDGKDGDIWLVYTN